MKKVKEFIKEHECEIKVVMGLTAGIAVGVTVGYCIGHTTSSENRDWIPDRIITLLKDAKHEYPNKFYMFDGRNNLGIKVADLGELGKAMIDGGAKDDDVFTHFIAIGPEVKT